MINAPTPMQIISNQNNIIVIQTKQPAQKRINTVKIIDMRNEKPTQMASRGQPFLRSEKYFCKFEISIYLLKSNYYIIYGGG
jgi:hypothetical protein